MPGKIKTWVKNIREVDSSFKKEYQDQLDRIKAAIDAVATNDSDSDTLIDLYGKIEHIQNIEDQDVVQKARVKWDIEGDENSRVFHGLINHRLNNQMIKGITINGDWMTDPLVVKDVFLEFFKAKFSRGTHTVEAPNFLHVNRLDIHDVDMLETVVFRMPKGASSTFVTLIPKISNPTCFKDYRPISLIGIQYKIIIKILANRLTKVIGKVICNVQTTFIAGRQILDGTLNLNETMEWYKKCKRKLMVLKVDFEKAYDSVS
ncbi:uncharacterized protein [Rutidosis leptorrhynchoides]|uniref:uncharacterized protein n=1 Tax=Rutidosis leptorrhynchoides TaxID=125765 RepID=UPI003A9A37BB